MKSRRGQVKLSPCSRSLKGADGELVLSPKHSSLVFDEVKEQDHESQHEICFEPELSLLINTRGQGNPSSQIVMVSGRVTVSF